MSVSDLAIRIHLNLACLFTEAVSKRTLHVFLWSIVLETRAVENAIELLVTDFAVLQGMLEKNVDSCLRENLESNCMGFWVHRKDGLASEANTDVLVWVPLLQVASGLDSCGACSNAADGLGSLDLLVDLSELSLSVSGFGVVTLWSPW